MALKERMQNPTLEDTVRLRLFIYNANNLADVYSIDQIDLYMVDPTQVCMENPYGKVHVATVDISTVVHEDTGTYYVDVPLSSPTFTVARYFDVWTITVDSSQPSETVENEFRIYPNLWYTTPIPVVYDFSFTFAPNKIRKGAMQYLRIQIHPNVPRATDLARYYENLAIVSDLNVSIELKCGKCVPQEEDLRLIVDEADVSYREKCFGYYFLDTTEMECGIYLIWFTLYIGGNTFVSDKMSLQVFE